MRIDIADASANVDGNRLTVLSGGPERLDALIALIDGAAHSLRLLYYMYNGDRTGVRVREALGRALDRGVTVALIIDGFGSDAPDDFFRPIQDRGARVCRFIPRLGRRYLLRNHQKLALADETRVLIGGFNIADDYFSEHPSHGWRDLGLLIEGPAAARLVGYFDALSDWTRQPRAPMRTLRRALRRWSEREGSVRWLLGGPARRLSPWARTVRRDMRVARRLDIIAAYFAPNPAILRRIEGVVRRDGGSARVLTASRSDNTATIGAARHCYRRLLKRGVEVFEYQPMKLHTKLVIVDDAVYIGSANFDMRSLYLNLEMMLRIEDADFAAQLRDYAQAERARSACITRQSHRARSTMLNRLSWSLSYFLVAVMDYTVSRRLNPKAE